MPRPSNMMKLSEMEKLFIANYMTNGFKAGPACLAANPGDKHPDQFGAIIKARPRVQKKIDELIAQKLSDVGLSDENILLKLHTVLFLDPIELFDVTALDGVWEVKDLNDIPPLIRQCIVEFKAKTRICAVTGDQEQYMELKLMKYIYC